MIRLIRHDGMEILLNTELIMSVGGTHKTEITLTNGETVVVKNARGDVLEKMRAYRIGKRLDRKNYEKKMKAEMGEVKK